MKTINSTGINPKQIMVDDEDYAYLSQFRWKLLHGKYPFRKEKLTRRSVYLYREIMNCPVGMVIDHLDHNPLNCQKDNLKICTREENSANRNPNLLTTSKLRGVSWHKGNKRWTARIRNKKKQINLGSFKTEEEAGEIYQKAFKEKSSLW